MKPIDLVNNSRDLLSFLDKKREDRHFYRLIEITITIGVVILFLVFAVRPSVLTISNLIGEIKVKEKVSFQMRKKINDVVTAQDVYAQIQEKYQLVDSALPVSPHFGQLTEQIVAAGNLTQSPVEAINFNVGNRQTSAETTFEELQSIKFTFWQATTFSDVKSFLAKILLNRRLFQINSLSFSSQKETSLISTGFDFESFYIPKIKINEKK